MLLFLLGLFPLLAAASPIAPRAGGPVATPIPANCTTINPLSHASCGTANVSGYAPSANFTAAHQIYSAYFESSLSQSAQATQCMQQCYGFGLEGSCKSALIGSQIPTPKGYYGTAGGVLETACLMYDAYLDPTMFVQALEGQYVNETVHNIYC